MAGRVFLPATSGLAATVEIEITTGLANFLVNKASKLWQHDTGEKYFPDLGELLRYFMAQRELMYRLYWILREGGYASDEYAEIMESIERKDFCRSNATGERPKTRSEDA